MLAEDESGYTTPEKATSSDGPDAVTGSGDKPVPSPTKTPAAIGQEVSALLDCWTASKKTGEKVHVLHHPLCKTSKPKKTPVVKMGPGTPDVHWCVRCRPVKSVRASNVTPHKPSRMSRATALLDASDAGIGVSRGLSLDDRGRVERFLASSTDLDVPCFNVVSWNVHGGMKQETVDTIRELAEGFDVLCLQEVGWDTIGVLVALCETRSWTFFHSGDTSVKNAVLCTVNAEKHDWDRVYGDNGHLLGKIQDVAYPHCTVLATKGTQFHAFFTSYHTEGSWTPETVEAAGAELEGMIERLNLVTVRGFAGVAYVHVYAGDLNYHQLSVERYERLEKTPYFHPPGVPTTKVDSADERATKMPADVWLAGPHLVDISSLLVSRERYGSDHHFVFGYIAVKRAVYFRGDGAKSMDADSFHGPAATKSCINTNVVAALASSSTADNVSAGAGTTTSAGHVDATGGDTDDALFLPMGDVSACIKQTGKGEGEGGDGDAGDAGDVGDQGEE